MSSKPSSLRVAAVVALVLLVALSGCLRTGGSPPAAPDGPSGDGVWHGSCEQVISSYWVPLDGARGRLPPGYEPVGGRLASLVLVVDSCTALSRGTDTLETDGFLAFLYLLVEPESESGDHAYVLDGLTNVTSLRTDLVDHGLPFRDGTLEDVTDTVRTLSLRGEGLALDLGVASDPSAAEPVTWELWLHHEDMTGPTRYVLTEQEQAGACHAVLKDRSDSFSDLLEISFAPGLCIRESGILELDIDWPQTFNNLL